MAENRARDRETAPDFVAKRAERERLRMVANESGILDLQLLDALGDVERLLQQTREIQRDALLFADLHLSRSTPLTDRQLAAKRICEEIAELRATAQSVVIMVAHLETTAGDLLRVLTVDDARTALARAEKGRKDRQRL
jgi:hypothetical protein